MHGPDHHRLYSGSCPDADLTWWADRIREWDLAGLDVFVYFNNDGSANAVRNARTLLTLPVSGGISPIRSTLEGTLEADAPGSWLR